MSKKERKNDALNQILEEALQDVQQAENRKKEILASTEYIEQLFQCFEEHDCVNKCTDWENKNSITKDLNLFFEVVDAYAKKNMVKNYADIHELADKIYYISYASIVACIMHKDIHYGGDVAIKKCNSIPDVEIVPFVDIMDGKVSDFLLERVKAKETFEQYFDNFLSAVTKTGVTLEEVAEYVQEFIVEKMWDNLA